MKHSAFEVFRVFLRLGLTSFGGPVAHLGYFRDELVARRRWLDDQAYTDLVALCQFLPGPTSSQVGMAIGLGRAGWWGALAAWLGFTAPSAIVLMALATGLGGLDGLSSPLMSGAVHGLKVVAVAVVAQAVWGMARTLCPDPLRAALAVLSALGVWLWPGFSGQIGVMLVCALAGLWAVQLPPLAAQPTQAGYAVGRRTGALLLGLFGLLLAGLPLLVGITGSWVAQAVAAFYRAGALVFGGGHVVLPLLQASVVPTGWVDAQAFLAGYGAAQAVPGPLFAFAAYLGVLMPAPLGGWWGGCVLLVAIFVPAFLLVAGALPFWQAARGRATVRRALAGVNAAVVGILAAALYDPLWTSAIRSPADLALALAAFVLLMWGRVPVALVVLGVAAWGAVGAAWLG